jgi:four helix bundle protein
MVEKIRRHTDLDVYKLAFDSANSIFKLSKTFPREELFSLTDQIRRSSRSVCANIAEAWRKRRYQAAFINCLNRAEAEAAETQVWLDFCYYCEYLDKNVVEKLTTDYDNIIGKFVNMIRFPEKWIL